MSDNFQPAVYSDPGRIIKYGESAQRFCDDVARQVNRLTDTDRVSELTAYRVYGEEVVELIWRDGRGKHLILRFLQVRTTPIDFDGWSSAIEHDDLEIPVGDMTDAILLAQFIVRAVETA
jgi:hypothetical protein